MNMKLRSLLFACGITLANLLNAQNTEPAYQIMGNDTTCQIFLYSPGDRLGLHVAYLAEDNSWQDVGQLCGSDYSRWGKEKRMYDPYVVHANDGTWRAVWSVNDHAPCFAVAYSEDLVSWRPQDFPRMSVQGCREPILFAMDDGTFDIYFKSGSTKHYVQASNDFRSFKESNEPSSIDDVAWLRDTATVDGRLFKGNLFDVPKVHLRYIRDYFHVLAADAALNAEKMADDAKRFEGLGEVKAVLKIDQNRQKPISDKLFGVFFEDISYAADGGLYAELVQNRDFEYTAADRQGWNATTAWTASRPIRIATEEPLSSQNPHYAVMDRDTLYNIGWDSIIDQGDAYDFSIYVRQIGCKRNQIDVALVDEAGAVVTEARVKTEGEGWRQYRVTFGDEKKRAEAAVSELRKCRLRLIARKEGRLAIDMVSLFPHETFKGHGLRKDLAEAIANLKPRFVRFPGGCLTHGQGLGNIYHWNQTIGPLQDRVPAKNIWNYHQTRGLGFYEYFQFCEDIGAEPLPVLAAGVPCQNSDADAQGYGGQQGGIPMQDMPAYIQELLDLIEWANGDPATSRWARMRAEAGHPAPFNLKYIGIGNEDLISTTFEERYLMICKAIREKHPEIIICGTVGPFHEPSADYAEGWRIARENQKWIDMVDEHYYESPGWFLHHQDYYDSYDRKGPKVYLGEYASKTRTMESALVEAIHLCNLERNGDVVAMSSYAPLLCNERHANWNPNLIYFNQTELKVTPSYQTQCIFGRTSGDRYVHSTLQVDEKLRYRLASSVVRDSRTGRTYLKLVNALPAAVSLSVEGMTLPERARYMKMSGKPADQSVSLDVTADDNHFVPLQISGQTVTLPPYSVVAIER